MQPIKKNQSLVIAVAGIIVLLLFTTVGVAIFQAQYTSHSTKEKISEESSSTPRFYDVDTPEIASDSETQSLAVLENDIILLSTSTRERIATYTVNDFEHELIAVREAILKQSPTTNITILTMLNDVFDVSFGPDNQSLRWRLEDGDRHRTTSLFEELLPDVELIVSRLAMDLNTIHPEQIDSTLPVIKHKNYGFSPSAPSLIATKAYIVSAILSELNPQQADAYAQYTNVVTDHLLISGQHFPIDLLVAEEVASNIMQSLSNNHRFRFLVETASVDWE